MKNESQEFDVHYWESIWETVRIPKEIKPSDIHEIHSILSRVLPAGRHSLIETGCAPGGWLAYFHNNFHYDVSGIEYAPRAFQKTRENLALLRIPADLFFSDVFDFFHQPYPIVFSAGFIEHFQNVDAILEKLETLCKTDGYIITLIPNLYGINRLISKLFRPEVAAGHFPINKHKLIEHHERLGITTLYCDHIGSLKVLLPMDKNILSKTMPLLSSFINLPFHAWNKAIDSLTKRLMYYPKIGIVSTSILYIGRKKSGRR